MNHLMKKLTLIVMTVFLLTACGGVETPSAPAPVVTSNPTIIENTPAVLVTGSAPDKFNHYIGLNYPPMPEGLSEILAMLIQDAEDHSLSLLSEGENKMLWLSQLTHHDSNGNAFWEVKDVLDLSDLESGVVLIPDGCSLNGQPDNEILVVGTDGVIQLAWRANTTLNVFEVLPITGIECQSDKAMELE